MKKILEVYPSKTQSFDIRSNRATCVSIVSGSIFVDFDVRARGCPAWNPPAISNVHMVRLYLSSSVYSVFFFCGRKRLKVAEIPVWHRTGNLNSIETRIWNDTEEGEL